VNVIGEHTDYNQGYVLPMAIEQATFILGRKRSDMTLDAYAANLDRSAQADLARPARDPGENWIDYIVGVANELEKLGKPVCGADVLVVGDVPIGCGLSSSASYEMAALVLFEAMGGFVIEGAEAPKLGRRVENDFLGLSTGIMDQFISRMGKAGHALFLDCRTYDYDLVPVQFATAKFIIANTCVARGLTSSKYNERVAQCGEAVAGLGAAGKQGTHLRDFTLGDLLEARANMSDIAYRRGRHVISEDDRTLEACEAMRIGDAVALGKLMDLSDESLRVDYEVTCPELDAMTAIARTIPGCFGSRMTGAGFGGCTISLVANEAVDSFAKTLLMEYHASTGLDGQIIVSSPGQGASRVA
jgi:galactokinase